MHPAQQQRGDDACFKAAPMEVEKSWPIHLMIEVHPILSLGLVLTEHFPSAARARRRTYTSRQRQNPRHRERQRQRAARRRPHTHTTPQLTAS